MHFTTIMIVIKGICWVPFSPGWGGGGGQGSMHFTTINTRTKTRQKLDDFFKIMKTERSYGLSE